jgi:hypothetical protein
MRLERQIGEQLQPATHSGGSLQFATPIRDNECKREPERAHQAEKEHP